MPTTEIEEMAAVSGSQCNLSGSEAGSGVHVAVWRGEPWADFRRWFPNGYAGRLIRRPCQCVAKWQ